VKKFDTAATCRKTVQSCLSHESKDGTALIDGFFSFFFFFLFFFSQHANAFSCSGQDSSWVDIEACIDSSGRMNEPLIAGATGGETPRCPGWI